MNIDRAGMRVLAGAGLVAMAVALAACAGGPAGPAGSGGAGMASSRYAAVPTPTITGPVPNEPFGSNSRNWQFFATDVHLGSHGYVEEEFFIEGMANVYDAPSVNPATPPSAAASVVSPNHPYKTRFVVRRPADPAKFNGIVVVEWNNVSDAFDNEYFWVQAKNYLLREGYAWVGLTAQNNSVLDANRGLKKFSPARYGAIDLTHGGTIKEDALSFDVFAQTVKAVRAVPRVMGNLPVKRVLGAGMSQSGVRLGVYANYLHQRAPIVDGILLHVPAPGIQPLRTDLDIPVLKVFSETEARTGPGNLEAAQTQPDTPKIRTWWAAGTAHGDATHRMGRTGVQARDIGWSVGTDTCGPDGTVTTRPRTPFRHIISAAVDHLNRWVDKGTPPPAAPAFVLTGASPMTVARDSAGNAQGGIRLAAMEVPVARANGGECGMNGAWVPFTTAQLAALYPSHADYVAKVTAAANASVAAGFVLPEDGAATIAEAKASLYGTGLECGPLCLSAGHLKPDFSSTGLLREYTSYYSIARGDALLDAVDAAHRAVATGYSSTGTTAKWNYGFGVVHLQRYIALVRQAEVEQRVTPTAANMLINQANSIIRGLQAL
ncbi:MAG: hypothetical protein HYX47_10140 [Burkholderiales bacterium]|nr:hypothetical protein [Burkholderiales bacterium]